MTGPEHYQEAEDCLTAARAAITYGKTEQAKAFAAMAAAHMQLAALALGSEAAHVLARTHGWAGGTP